MYEVLAGEDGLDKFLLRVAEEGPMLGKKDIQHNTC